MKKNRQNILFPLFLTASMSLVGCTANEINASAGIVGHLFKGFTVTNEQLASQARLSAQALDRKHQIASANDPYTQRLNRLVRGLHHYDGMNLNFKVYRSDKINAFAMPDGTVRVYTGLMDIMNDDELVAVIGHEIGHVKAQHTLNQYRKAYMAKAAAAGLVAYGSDTVSALTGSYGNIGLAAIDAQFSQSDELDADVYGVGVLHNMGRNPYAAVKAQKKLMAQGGGKGGFFSSHPASRKRIQVTQQAADAISKR